MRYSVSKVIAAICATLFITAVSIADDARVVSQHLALEAVPATNTAHVTSHMTITGSGHLEVLLTKQARITGCLIAGKEVAPEIIKQDDDSLLVSFNVPAGVNKITLVYKGAFVQDASEGERPGQIHNHSVNAHIGTDGIFLSDGSNWHPIWIDPETQLPALMNMSIDITRLDNWLFVASGEPIKTEVTKLMDPNWHWRTPRPVDGLAVVAGQHVITTAVHQTEHGPVEIVMHTSPDNKELAPLFVDATKQYLDIYVPLLGKFPYKRFSIVENFFSSGFAFPGFTLLGPHVVGMGERALSPGYLDHELVHNWWGNGVYVDPDNGNWCEALTSYCANYYRRIADDGEDAGKDYRRGILMKLSADLQLDNGPLDSFGHDPNLDRFVGYDKGAFIFMMLEGTSTNPKQITQQRNRLWKALRLFNERYLGKRAGWDELQTCFEEIYGKSLESFFQTWVHTHTVPLTIDPNTSNQVDGKFKTQEELIEWFAKQISPDQKIPFRISSTDISTGKIEIDPNFKIYRALPAEHVVPTIGGTKGIGGMRIETGDESRDEITSFLKYNESDSNGVNLLLIGLDAIYQQNDLITRCDDTVRVGNGWFEVGDEVYDKPGQAMLHTMAYPDRPGRFISVFAANDIEGWAKLRYIGYYTRDTTVIWEDGDVIKRRTHEPSRLIDWRK